VLFSSLRRVCDDPFPTTPFPLHKTILRRPVCVFKAWRNLSVRCCQTTTKPWGGTVPPPVGRPRAQVKERVGRTTPFSSSAMSSDRLFLDRVARQHGPSPLHRYRQINTHSAEAQAEDDISTLPAKRHFYFALTVQSRALDNRAVVRTAAVTLARNITIKGRSPPARWCYFRVIGRHP
jgi:hypothetical protein